MLLTAHLVFSLKYSVSYKSKMIKGRSSRVLRKEFPHLKEWCGDHLWAMAGMWLRNISQYIIHTSITGDNPEKTLYTGLGHLSGVYW